MSDFFKMMGEASEKSGKKVKISFEFVGEVLKQEDIAKEDTVKEVAKEAPQILTEIVEAVNLNQPLEHIELDSFLMDLQVTEELAPPKERVQFPPWYNKEEEKPKKERKKRSARRLTEEQRLINRKEYNRVARERAQAKKNKENVENPFGAVKPGGKKADGKYWVYKPLVEGEILI